MTPELVWSWYCPYLGFPSTPVAPNAETSNIINGATRITGSNIAFVQGSLDPWHPIGILQNGSTSFVTSQPYYIEGGSHCNDAYAPRPDETPEVTKVHEQLVAAIASWLAPYPVPRPNKYKQVCKAAYAGMSDKYCALFHNDDTKLSSCILNAR